MAFNKAKALEEAERSVSQGKIPQAIKQYLQIIEKDPSDLSLLNTIGDLYARERNVPAALKLFKKLADAYVKEGFAVKAIAIYKKIAKLVPKNVEPILTLAELYLAQGLTREAREQYVQAFDFYKRENQNDKALEMLRKIVKIDPENITHRARLATFCEQLKLESVAAQAYMELAEIALGQGNTNSAESAVKKARDLDPKNPKINLLMARLALKSHQPEKVEKIIAARPELKADRTAQHLLLEAYLAAHNAEAAEKLVTEIYRANPADFTPVASFSASCLEASDLERALRPLAEVAGELIEQKNTGPLMEALRRIWGRAPQHLPALELIYRICERTGDEYTLPEILEALGHAYVHAGKLTEAETIYRKLLNREPENEQHKRLLRQVLEMQGKEVGPAQAVAQLSKLQTALAPEEAVAIPTTTPAQRAAAEQAATIKEALENSDLYARYGLVQKAVAELERVLALYPGQIEVHQRLLEVCQRNQPARAAQAAEALARIHTELGDPASAKKYRTMAREAAAAASQEAAALTAAGLAELQVAPRPGDGSPGAPAEAPRPAELAGQEEARPPAAEELPGAPGLAPEDLPARAEVAASSAKVPARTEEVEFDLTGEWETVVAAEPRPELVQGAGPFNYEESRVEIDFYLGHGFLEQAQKAVLVLEQKYPVNPQIADLRQRVAEHASREIKAAEAGAVEPESGPLPGEPGPAEAVSAPGPEEWELPETFAEPPPPLEPERPAAAEAAAPPQSPGYAPGEAGPTAPQPPMLGSDNGHVLAGEPQADREGLDVTLSVPSSPTAREVPVPSPASEATSPLSSLLEELGEPATEQREQEDLETLYNLGVAFREMGLLDEAIGEFQKLLRSAGKGNFPAHYLQACSLLALSFMEKRMPAIAAKWYLRALESPDLDESATLALHYDLGLAYEQAGEVAKALERFIEVYSQNIDYRDVAEKIRLLRDKVP